MIRYVLFPILAIVVSPDFGLAREWTDVTGTFKVEAELLEATDEVVRLQRSDTGKVITVPIDKLSPADRQHLKSLREDAPAGEWKNYPFPKEGFHVDFPNEPVYSKEEVEEGIFTHTYEAGVEGSDVLYTVVIDSLEEEADAAGAQEILDGIAESLAEITTSKRPIRLDGNPGVALLLEFEEDGVELVIQNRVYIVDARIIQAMVAAPAAEKESAQFARFFDSFKLSAEKEAPSEPADEASYSGRSFAFTPRSGWPSFLAGNETAELKADGLFVSGDIHTKSGNLLDRDFKFEVVFPLQHGSPIVLVGIGKTHKEGSAYMRIHHEYLKSGVGLAKDGQTSGTKRIGGDLPTGMHRAIITKRGDAVTFAIDVDNDGPTEDDIESTIPDIKVFQPKLHSKNTHLFFGHGTFSQVRLTYDPEDKSD